MSISSLRAFPIALGTSTPEESTVYYLGTGTAGTPDALRWLTHPLSASFDPIAYQRNPDETSNLDNEVIPVPISTVVLTQESTKVHRFERDTEDVIVRERWFAAGKVASMETQFFRQLVEYWLNPPALNPSAQTYIQWQPRDRNDYTYNVELVQIRCGGASGELIVREVLPDPGEIGAGMQKSDVPGSGLLMKPVELIMKMVSKVV